MASNPSTEPEVRIFLSYSRQDLKKNKFAILELVKLLKDFEGHGYSLRWDESGESQPGGTTLSDGLKKWIEECNVGLVLISPNYLRAKPGASIDYARLEYDHMTSHYADRFRSEDEHIIRVALYPLDQEEWRAVGDRGALKVEDLSIEEFKEQHNYNWTDAWKHALTKLKLPRELGLRARGSRSPAAVRHRHSSSTSPWQVVGADEIVARADAGTLRPFLGPMCQRLPENYRPARAHFAERITRLETALGGDEKALAFARTVMSRIPEPVLAEVRSMGKITQTPGPAGLLGLQVSLARLGAMLSKAIGAHLNQSPEELADVAALRIRMPPADLDRCESLLNEAIDNANTLARKWSANHALPECKLCRKNNPSCVGANGISRHLSTVLGIIQRLESGAAGSFSLEHFEWVGDLLWHTLRFDAPIVPASHELAFQLSISITYPREGHEYETSGPHRADLGAVAAGVPSPGDVVEEWTKCNCTYRPGSGVTPDEQGEFYETMADVLASSYSEGSCEAHQVPVAINSNLDRNLEIALERRNLSYNVLIPICGPGGEEVPRRWLIRKRRRQGGEDKPKEWILVGQNATWESYKKWLTDGPLIVQMRGAPLHGLPEASPDVAEFVDFGDESSYSRFKLNILLSDSHVFANMFLDREERLPGFVRQMLSDNCWCLLGYQMPDLHQRLALHDHFDYMRELLAPTEMFVVDYPADPFRHSLFMEHPVKMVFAPLSKVVEELRQKKFGPLAIRRERNGGAA